MTRWTKTVLLLLLFFSSSFVDTFHPPYFIPRSDRIITALLENKEAEKKKKGDNLSQSYHILINSSETALGVRTPRSVIRAVTYSCAV